MKTKKRNTIKISALITIIISLLALIAIPKSNIRMAEEVPGQPKTKFQENVLIIEQTQAFKNISIKSGNISNVTVTADIFGKDDYEATLVYIDKSKIRFFKKKTIKYIVRVKYNNPKMLYHPHDIRLHFIDNNNREIVSYNGNEGFLDIKVICEPIAGI